MERVETNRIAGYLRDLDVRLAAKELRANDNGMLQVCGNRENLGMVPNETV